MMRILPARTRCGIARVSGQLGWDPPSRVHSSWTPHPTRPRWQWDLAPSQQGQVRPGDGAQITLPGNKSVTGKGGTVGDESPKSLTGQNNNAGDATIPPTSVSDDPEQGTRTSTRPRSEVEITTEGVESALSVRSPRSSGSTGGGVRGRKSCGPAGDASWSQVELGLFDTTAGRVEVKGDLREGDQVVVPSL